MFRSGVRARSDRFIGQVKLNTLGFPRLGLAVAKKSCRAASDRNRIKRVIREYFRENKACLESRDFIILVTPIAASATRASLVSDLEKVFRQLCKRTSTTSMPAERTN